MAGKCSKQSCFPEETGCNIEGHLNINNCQFFDNSKDTEIDVLDDNLDSIRIAWTGSSFGLTDLNFLTASTRPIVVAIAGVASAGKTTFLASLYCLIRKGFKIGDYHFSGSLTLSGWEDIAWYLSWTEKGTTQFPPHTTSNSGRVPGLLHLSLKNANNDEVDIVFTDAPGEWFDEWRTNINSDSATGAKWIHQHSDAFLIFADCEMLAESSRGLAINQVTSVADRITENISKRPLGLIWSKSDVKIKQITRDRISNHLIKSNLTHFKDFEVSVEAGTDNAFHLAILDSIDWIISSINNNRNDELIISSMAPEDMFLSKRRN